MGLQFSQPVSVKAFHLMDKEAVLLWLSALPIQVERYQHGWLELGWFY
jgi:hypothetical protein